MCSSVKSSKVMTDCRIETFDAMGFCLCNEMFFWWKKFLVRCPVIRSIHVAINIFHFFPENFTGFLRSVSQMKCERSFPFPVKSNPKPAFFFFFFMKCHISSNSITSTDSGGLGICVRISVPSSFTHFITETWLTGVPIL